MGRYSSLAVRYNAAGARLQLDSASKGESGSVENVEVTGVFLLLYFFFLNTPEQRGGDKTLSPPVSVDLGSAFCQNVEEARNPQLLTG